MFTSEDKDQIINKGFKVKRKTLENKILLLPTLIILGFRRVKKKYEKGGSKAPTFCYIKTQPFIFSRPDTYKVKFYITSVLLYFTSFIQTLRNKTLCHISSFYSSVTQLHAKQTGKDRVRRNFKKHVTLRVGIR